MTGSRGGAVAVGGAVAANLLPELPRLKVGTEHSAGVPADGASKHAAPGGMVNRLAPRSAMRCRTRARTWARSSCHWPMPSNPPVTNRTHRT